MRLHVRGHDCLCNAWKVPPCVLSSYVTGGTPRIDSILTVSIGQATSQGQAGGQHMWKVGYPQVLCVDRTWHMIDGNARLVDSIQVDAEMTRGLSHNLSNTRSKTSNPRTEFEITEGWLVFFHLRKESIF